MWKKFCILLLLLEYLATWEKVTGSQNYTFHSRRYETSALEVPECVSSRTTIEFDDRIYSDRTFVLIHIYNSSFSRDVNTYVIQYICNIMTVSLPTIDNCVCVRRDMFLEWWLRLNKIAMTDYHNILTSSSENLDHKWLDGHRTFYHSSVDFRVSHLEKYSET